LWVEFGLVNGALGYIEDIFYSPHTHPPQFPQYATIIFEKYTSAPFHKDYPNLVPVTPIARGNLRHMPLKMACVLNIQKS